MDNYTYYRVHADIDLDAVRGNVSAIQSNLSEGCKTCAVIKADGYGHGAVPIAKKLKNMVDFFAVATIDEATNLRLHNISLPILILGYIHPANTITAIRNDIRMTVFDLDTALKIAEAAKDIGKPAKIHIKADTGMSRIGFTPSEENLKIIKEIYDNEWLEAEGIFTHFYLSDGSDLSAAYRQLEIFKSMISDLEDMGVHFDIRHCANSAAATRMREADMDMVRLGISMYGLYPSEFTDQITLKPAMSLKSHIVMIKDIEAGTSVGYGATFTAERRTRIATIPVGYADGYFRRLSGKGEVLIRGKRARVCGRICMDQFMVDVTEIPEASVQDEVTLIGPDGDDAITMEEISALAGSFNYEFACDIGKRVPRIYYADGEEYSTKDYFYDRY